MIGTPVFALSVALAILVQRVAFMPAYLLQGEGFFDLTGSVAYISVTIPAVVLGPVVDGRSILLLALLMPWAAGFVVEAAADVQKSRFRARLGNRGKSIHTGLWAWSRHPDYFGEIVLWIVVAVIALPVLLPLPPAFTTRKGRQERSAFIGKHPGRRWA